ncbi:GumC family protein [Neorhodopirellula pilleata]|uniref:Tyrosine-protein kinase ptk n=1 Tax=Neorhodopirellula pilleata TaxID=2714738 RepID=A0A5C6ABN1_9BACT|nr:GumC family protein [Neorhodopirellula pilleata]TWT96471.1 Tyrosine-protein kinase ptk [Neorhodopirellula pilleata]
MNHRPFTIVDAVRGILRRKKYVASFFLMTCFLIGLATALTRKSYESEARLFMRLGRENTSLDATATLGEHPVVMLPLSREAEINSIVELIQSKQLYENVVDSIGADRILDPDWGDEDAEESGETSLISTAIGEVMSLLVDIGVLNDLPAREKAVIRIQKKIEVEAFEKSNVLTIRFTSYSPQLAQEVVDHLIANYQTQHVNLHRPPRAFEFLEVETLRIQESLDQARRDLEDFKNETGILESTQQRTVLIDRLAKLRLDLLVAESTEAALKTEVHELTEGLKGMPENISMSETVGAGNEGADGMRQELFRLEVLRESLAAKYTDSHPALKQIEKQLRETKSLFTNAESVRKESIIGPNRIHQDTAVTLEQKRSMLAAEQARVAKLQAQLDEMESTLHLFTANERRFAELDRNVDVLEANYRKYFANLEQARIDTKMKSQEFSNVGIAQAATLNLKPSAPNKLINLIAAIFLGTVGGVGLAVFLEYLNPSVSSEEDIEQAAGAGVIAWVPELTADQLRLSSRSIPNRNGYHDDSLTRLGSSARDVISSNEQA